MKILLIVPRYGLTNKKDYTYVFPLGLGYISSVLKEANYEVDCFNLNHFEGTTEFLINRQLNRKKYDFVCSGHMGIGYAAIEKIINATRKHKSRPKVIIGGALITSEPELMFKSLKPDFAVVGEGEKTIVKLLNCLGENKNPKKIEGIIYWDKGKVCFTPPRSVIENLDSLPFPDFEGLGFEEQLKHTGNESGYHIFDYPRPYPILTSRGCPFQCTFCYHSLGERYRKRSIKEVMKELEFGINKYKINLIAIYDDLFAIDRKRLFDFCKKIKKLIAKFPWEIQWTCQLTVRDVDKKMLETLRDSGCSAVSYGFESYSRKVLKSMKKNITPEQIDNAIKLSMGTGMSIQGNFIFGDVAETKQTAYKTLNYWKKNCKGQTQLGFIQAYPGSAIYKHSVSKGIIKNKLDFIKNKIRHTNWLNMTDEMTDQEILQLKKDILKARRKYSYYVLPSKIRRTKNKKYTLQAKCPFCKKTINYANTSFNSKFYYTMNVSCRNCNMRFFIVSRLYKFTVDHYQQLDILRRNYLFLRDRFLKKRL